MTALKCSQGQVEQPGGPPVGAWIADHLPAPNAQDTCHLPGRTERIREVMEGGRAQDRGELARRKRKALTVAPDELGVRHVRGELAGAANHAGGEVDADRTLRNASRPANGRTAAAADIEKVIVREETQALER